MHHIRMFKIKLCKLTNKISVNISCKDSEFCCSRLSITKGNRAATSKENLKTR
jgi:hypothetical protein